MPSTDSPEHTAVDRDELLERIDVDGLRAKYKLERDKRMRNATRQYHEPVGDFAKFVDDPYAEQVLDREPLTDEVEVAIIGGGFGGLLIGAHLRQAGVEDLRIIEKGSNFGGTWYWNRFPGARCDVESYVYLPLLEEVGYMPSEKYATGPEILSYAHALARHFDLYRNACLQTQVTELQWDDSARLWTILTTRGDRIRARYVTMALGALHRPRLPAIQGIESFRGAMFHSSRWDYEYTGGNSTGGLTGLADKRVGVIGTGATGIQVIPMLAEWSEQLFVFQRTPPAVDRRGNRPTDTEWAKQLPAGWQAHRMENFTVLTAGGTAHEDLVDDAWTEIVGSLAVSLGRERAADEDPQARAVAAEMADFLKMEQIRDRVADIVHDPVTAEALKPYYRMFCKRPCFHDAYLDTFNRANVHLVDTDGQGPERVTETSVVVAGREYPIDCLVLASGFEYGTDYVRRAEYDILGRGGIALSQRWRDGARTMHGMHVHGFPNCFIVSTIQAGQSPNFVYVLNEQAKHVAYVIAQARDRRATLVEVTQDAEDAWVRNVRDHAVHNMAYLEACTPGIYNNEGQPSERSVLNLAYGGGILAFQRLIEQWRVDGRLEGLELSR